MSSSGVRGTLVSSACGHTSRAAARYLDADAASTTDIDDDVEERDGSRGGSADGEGAGPSSRRAAVEISRKPAAPPRPANHGASPGAPQQQPSLSGRGLSSGRSNPITSRRDSSEGSPLTQQQPGDTLAATYGAGLTPFLPNPSGAAPANRRLHPNGLPIRQPAGPLPGVPYISDLAARYPVRQAPASGPQIALVSGQLYVSERLREAMSSKKTTPSPSPPHAAAGTFASSSSGPAAGAHAGPPGAGGFPTPDMLIPTYADQPYPTSSYMQQRRAEKEQRALYTGQYQAQPQQSAGRAGWASPDANASPGPVSSAPGQLTAGRVSSATAGPSGRNSGGVGCSGAGAGLSGSGGTGGGGGGIGGGGGGDGRAGIPSRQREVREGVERWLETNEVCNGEQDAGPGGRPQARQPDTSNDPSLMYRQYGIFRSYAKHSQGLWPSMSMPTTMTSTQRTGGGGGGGLRVAFERDRTSSGASGASPKRPSSQTAPAAAANAWPPTRQSAW